MAAAALIEAASAVLDENWIGGATKPTARLYPHQWSWDSAFVAIGNRHQRWDRAVEELETLFAAQWANGMVPHIVFGAETDDYFPGAGFWDSRRCATAPTGPATSGICQPPVHATAVRLVYQTRRDAEGRRFVEDMCPRLIAWHEYLHRVRAVDSPLVEIWHPWESGRDNSPDWDQPLAGLVFSAADIPSYRRADTNHVAATDRPSDAEYDAYLFLVDALRRQDYTPGEPRALQFRIRDVLFNSLLVRAEADLAELLEAVGGDGTARRDRAAALLAAIETDLWSDATALYHSADSASGERLPTRSSGGFGPLLTGLPDGERRSELVATLERDFLVPVGDDAAVPLTVPVDEPGFDAARYWRGPAWIHMSWLIASGLEASGLGAEATRLRNGIVSMCTDIGFFEYFDPRTLSGHGADRFSWSAALLIDVVSSGTVAPGPGTV